MKGSGGLCWYLPWTVRMSGKFTAAARLRTRAWPGPGGGRSVPSSRRVPMSSAISRQTMAFTAAPSRHAGLGGGMVGVRQGADAAQEQGSGEIRGSDRIARLALEHALRDLEGDADDGRHEVV